MANNGMVNSATIKIMLTALNLLYPGMLCIKKSVKLIKFFPQARVIVRSVTIKIGHLIGFLIINKPISAKKTIIAPI